MNVLLLLFDCCAKIIEKEIIIASLYPFACVDNNVDAGADSNPGTDKGELGKEGTPSISQPVSSRWWWDSMTIMMTKGRRTSMDRSLLRHHSLVGWLVDREHALHHLGFSDLEHGGFVKFRRSGYRYGKCWLWFNKRDLKDIGREPRINKSQKRQR